MKSSEVASQLKLISMVLLLGYMYPVLTFGSPVEQLCVDQNSDRHMMMLDNSRNEWSLQILKNKNGINDLFVCTAMSDLYESKISTQQLVQVLYIIKSTQNCSVINKSILVIKENLKIAREHENQNRFASAIAIQNLTNQLKAFELSYQYHQCLHSEVK